MDIPKLKEENTDKSFIDSILDFFKLSIGLIFKLSNAQNDTGLYRSKRLAYLLLAIHVGHTLTKEAAQTLFVCNKCIVPLVGNTADGVGETPQTALVDLKIACFLQRLDLYADVTSCGISNITQIDEVGTFQTVKGDHDL